MEPSEEKQSDPLAEGIKSKLRDHFDHVREKINKEDAIKLAKNFEKKFNGVRDKYRDHPTLGALVRQCELLYWVMRDWVKGEYEMPWFAIAAITASLLYVISPIDFIPDFIPVAFFNIFQLG